MNKHIGLKEKVSYGFGDMASSMFWKLFGMYLLFFYTDVFGISAAAVGTMFLVTRIWDTVFDPIVGVLSDRTQTKWGKFRPYLLFMALPFGIIGFLTFTTPALSPSGKLIYAYITYSLMMMIYSLINVPYASLLGVISDQPKERNALASYRMSFAFMGGVVVLAIIEPLVDFFSRLKGSDVNLKWGWQMGVGIISILCITLFLLCFAGVKERVKPLSNDRRSSLKSDFKDLLNNKPWWILLASGVAALVFNSIRDGATIYYFKYFIMEESSFKIGGTALTYSTLYLVLGQVANVFGVVSASFIANKIGKKKTYLGAMSVAFVLSIIFYWFNKSQLQLIFLFQFLISFCAGIVFPLLWSMYADISDYSELKTGRRSTGLIFSSSSMSQKFGWTIGGALTGWLLAYFGFQANNVQTVEALKGIRLMLSFLPAAGALLSIVFIAIYPLSENKVEEITLALKQKRTRTDK